MSQLAMLRAQQRDLARLADVVRSTADSIDGGTPMVIWDGLTAVVGGVNRQLLPYLDAEEDILHSTLRAIIGTPEVVRVLQIHAKELERLCWELHDGRNALLAGEGSARTDLRRVLYGLHAVLTLHLRTSAEVVVPFLEEELDARDSEQVDIAMHAVMGCVPGDLESGDETSNRAG